MCKLNTSYRYMLFKINLWAAKQYLIESLSGLCYSGALILGIFAENAAHSIY